MMKKLTLVVSILLFAFTVHSQNKEWSIGLIGAPNFYNIKPMKGVDFLSYKNDLGLTIGLETVYSFNQKLNLGLSTFGDNDPLILVDGAMPFTLSKVINPKASVMMPLFPLASIYLV